MKTALEAKAPSSSTPMIFSKAISESVQHLIGEKLPRVVNKKIDREVEKDRRVGKRTDVGNRNQQKQS